MANSRKPNHRNGSKKTIPTKRAGTRSAGSAPARKTSIASSAPTSITALHRPLNGPTLEAKPTEVTRQQIAEAAYFLWQERGGSEVVNWLEAERMLKTRKELIG